MIGKLSGRIDSVGDDWAVVDVGGVGYLVHCSGRTLSRFETGTHVALQIETHVREDSIMLYGFPEPGERDLFRMLVQVQGVGGRVALALLTALSGDEIVRSIAADDRKMLTRAEGVGSRLATRIVTELRDRIQKTSFPGLGTSPPTSAANGGATPSPADDLASDAVSALVNLGYGRSEAFGAVAAVLRNNPEGATVETVIRAGLKELGR